MTHADTGANPAAELLRAIETVDLPRELAEAAEYEYGRVTSWLVAEDSPLRDVDLELYPQGSFRLGTPVRPLHHEDEFDIDLVCRLGLAKERVTQADLKEMVGARLRTSTEYEPLLQERRRCWTLNFPGRFHLDVLPTIPDEEHGGTHVLLTDTQLARWQFSNPIGYAEWFYGRMRVLLTEARTQVAKAGSVSVDNVPEWRVRTPLQQAVQVLKRHRDVHFGDRFDVRPVSVLLTTLAAHAYRQEERDVLRAVRQIVDRMPERIERRNGRWWVENPAQPNENFADKWNERPALREAFDGWHAALRRDVGVLEAASTREARVLIEKRFAPLARSSAPSAAGTVAKAASRGVLLESVASVPGPEGTDHAERPPWPLADGGHSCAVGVRAAPRIHAARFLGERAPSVLWKGAGLRFDASTDVPPPFQVYWQVTNTGAEARAARQLRGGFVEGEGPNGTRRWERTAYGGTHYVEAFVVRGGRLLARSGRVPVRITR